MLVIIVLSLLTELPSGHQRQFSPEKVLENLQNVAALTL